MFEDSKYVMDVQENSNEDSLKILIERHSGIYVNMINRFVKGPRFDNLRNDLISEKNTFIYECIQKYDPTKKTKFSTYLGNCVKWRCWGIFNNPKNKNLNPRTTPIHNSYEVFHRPDIFEEVDLHEKESLIEMVLNMYPDERAVEIFRLRYFEGDKNKVMPWKKIGKKLDLSSQACINIHNKLIETIKKTYEQSNDNW